MTYNTLLVLLGAGTLGAAAGLIGTFAVLRKQALGGDMLAHAALPGLCVGFLVAGDRNLAAMMFGALATGLLGLGCVRAITTFTRVKSDAALGIVLSVFFGAGVALSRIIQNATWLPGSKAGLDSYILGKTAGMIASDVMLIAAVAIVCAVVVIACYKEFLTLSFDPAFARASGGLGHGADFLLTGLVAAVVVIGLPAVGVVMIAALLILPAVTARCWSNRLSTVLVLAACFGVLMGAGGAAVSAMFARMPAGPVIALVGAAMFALSVIAKGCK